MSTTETWAPPGVVAPAINATARVKTGWFDRLLGSDPGLNRLRLAVQGVLTIGLILEAELLFVRLTHALQRAIPHRGLALQAAAAAVANHEFLVVAELLGALVGMISTFTVMDSTATEQLVSMAIYPAVMLPALALGITIGGHRTAALVLLVVVLTTGTYLRRFGPRGFTVGVLLFVGYLIGFFLHAGVAIADLGWLAAEVGLGLVVASVVRFGVFYPRQRKAFERTQRSYGARARNLAFLALELFENPSHGERSVRRLQHHLNRLNEAALMIDAQLGDPNVAIEGSSAQQLHQSLFDVELAITNVARFAQALARLDLPTDQRSEVLLALSDIVRHDPSGARDHARNLVELLRGEESVPHDERRTREVLTHRFASSVIAFADAGVEWVAFAKADGGGGAFRPSVALLGGWLPGSAQTSAVASLESGARHGEVALASYTRAAIQMGVAVGGAIVLGVQISSDRFYWAVIAAFVTFMAAHNSAEQVRKGFSRVAGTVIGIGIGSLFVDAVGHDVYGSVAVVLGALFFGFYLLRVNYAFMVVGITVMVSQLYLELDEFSNSLLLVRLEETAVGAAFAMIVAITVLPLRTRRVLQTAFRDQVKAIGRLVDHASASLLAGDENIDGALRADAREIDAAYQALIATAGPLRRSLSGKLDEEIGWVMLLASASRHYSRNLVVDVETAELLDGETCIEVERAVATLRGSLAVVVTAAAGPRDACYTRSSALFDRAERQLQERSESPSGAQLAVRDFMLIDGVLARTAEVMGLSITDYDTVGVIAGNVDDDGRE